MQTPTFLILFLAPVYVPLDLLTGWVAGRGVGEPAHRRAWRPGASLISGGSADLGLAFAAALGLAAVFALWSFRGLRSAEAAGG